MYADTITLPEHLRPALTAKLAEYEERSRHWQTPFEKASNDTKVLALICLLRDGRVESEEVRDLLKKVGAYDETGFLNGIGVVNNYCIDRPMNIYGTGLPEVTE